MNSYQAYKVAKSLGLEPVLFGKYLVDQETGCWEWQKCKDPYGYGKMLYKGKPVLVHRYSLATHLGKDLETLKLVRHKCDNPGCINPNHLLEGNHSQNFRDKHERQGGLKLTVNDVKEIRDLLKSSLYSRAEIARIYNVSVSLVYQINKGKTWEWVA